MRVIRSVLLSGALALAFAWASPPAYAQRTTADPNGALTATNPCVTLDVEGMGTGTIDIAGTWTGTVTFYVGGILGTRNGVDVAKADTPGTAVNTTTANGVWTVPVAGYKWLTACFTTPTSGTVRVGMLAAGTGGGSGGGGAGAASDVTSNGENIATQTTLADVLTQVSSAALSLNNIEGALAPESTHANAVIATGAGILCEAKDIDGAALPNTVTEGQASRVACGLNGGVYAVLMNEAGTADIGASMLTALQLIDDPVFADEGAFTYTTSKVMAFGACAESTTDASADGTIVCPVTTLNRVLRVTPTGYLSGGAVPVTIKSNGTNDDEKTAVCTGPCTVYSITAFNHAATAAFLRCENDTSANTTPGSETASDGEPDFEIPGNTAGAGYTVPFPMGISYGTALTCWVATGEAATDTTDAGTDDVSILISRVQ